MEKMGNSRGHDSVPNILWICTDQQRFDTIRSLGNGSIHTPNIDRLVRTGLAFTHAFCQCPVCTPSRGSFLTGRYPSTTGLRQNGQQIPAHEVPVTRLLRDQADYVCGLSGKLHLGPCQGRPEARVNDGYDEFFWSHSNFPKWPENQYTQWLLDELGHRWDDVYSYSMEKVASAGPVGGLPDGNVAWAGQPRELHQSYWCTSRALDFMRQQCGKRWLFSVNYFDPHHPFDPPAEYFEKYTADAVPSPRYIEGELDNKPIFQRIDHEGAYGGHGLSFTRTDDHEHRCITAAYYAMIQNIDFNVGRLLDYLEESGERDDTLIVFMSDHGEMLGDHGIYLKGPYLYDSVTRVPLIISWPGRFGAGTVTQALVELVDIAPTLVQAAGLKPVPGMQGKSLYEICCDPTGTREHRRTVYSEYYNAMPEHRNPRPFLASVRDNDFRIVVYAGLEDGELYDLKSDPGEHRNLWYESASRAVRSEYTRKCMDRIIFAADPLPPRVASF